MVIGEPRRFPDGPRGNVPVAIAADGSTVVAGDVDGSVKTWGADDWRKARVIGRHEALITAIAISRDGKRVASAGYARQVEAFTAMNFNYRLEGAVLKVWEAETDRLVCSIDPLTIPSGLAVDAGRREVAAILRAKPDTMTVWGEDGRKVFSLGGEVRQGNGGHNEPVRDEAFGRDFRRVAAIVEPSAERFNLTTLWDRESKRSRSLIYPSATSSICCVALSPDEESVALMCFDNSLSLWDFSSGKIRATGPAMPPGVSPDYPIYLGYEPPGRRIISGGADGGLRFWDATSAELLQFIQGPKGLIRDVAFLPGGRLRVVSGGWSVGQSPQEQKELRVWEVGPGPEP